MLKTVAIAVAVLIVAILIFAATKPDTFTVKRTQTIKAPPQKIFALINDLHKWRTWSPYEKYDPALKRTYSGAEEGKGAIYEWEGNNKAGTGRMEIIESTSPSKIVIKLHFIKPFEGNTTGEFTIDTQGDTSTVTWGMSGPSAYMSKVMSVFMNMDKLVGDDFADGLANLKKITEAEAAPASL